MILEVREGEGGVRVNKTPSYNIFPLFRRGSWPPGPLPGSANYGYVHVVAVPGLVPTCIVFPRTTCIPGH